MKWQLLATVIEDPGFTNRVSHVHMHVERDLLRCTCRKEKPMAYAPGDIEMPPFGVACTHVRGLYQPGFNGNAKINFTQEGRTEFEWRWAVLKLALSAPP